MESTKRKLYFVAYENISHCSANGLIILRLFFFYILSKMREEKGNYERKYSIAHYTNMITNEYPGTVRKVSMAAEISVVQ